MSIHRKVAYQSENVSIEETLRSSAQQVLFKGKELRWYTIMPICSRACYAEKHKPKALCVCLGGFFGKKNGDARFFDLLDKIYFPKLI
jgi:hypothetical protein